MENGGLTKTTRALKSEQAIGFLIFLALSLGAYIVYTYIIKEPPEVPLNIPYENSIYPGLTTRDQLESHLGDPLKKELEGGSENYFYETENRFRNDEISVSNEVVSLVKEQVLNNERGTLTEYVNQLGTEEAVLYGQHGTFAPAYFWGYKGLMVFANVSDGTIIEIWYFPPTTKENFISKYPSFSENIDEHREQFTQF